VTDRGSSHHSPRIDDALAKETESLVRGTHEARAEEWRMMEPPAEDEPLADALPAEDDIEFRSLLATSLRPSVFPCRRSRLLGVAQEEFAPDRVIAVLRSLPADREFVNVQDIWETLGGETELREHEPVEPVAPVTAQREPQPELEVVAPAPAPSLVEQAVGIVSSVVRVGSDLVAGALRRVRSLR